MKLVDVSKGRSASTNADRRRGPKLPWIKDALVRAYFEAQRRKK